MCGYSLELADMVYGKGYYDLNRVTDPAGALKQDEVDKLSSFLEQLERRITPAALVVFITDQGQSTRFTQHAHWLLNHGKLNHASFGKRSMGKAIEESSNRSLKVDIGAQTPTEVKAAPTELSLWLRFWASLKELIQRPQRYVEPQWILMLTVDVQLNTACFTWGYKLDRYIIPQQLENCIKDTRLRFRESPLLLCIKTVLQKAVNTIASSAVDTNVTLRRELRSHASSASMASPITHPSRGLIDFSQVIKNAESRAEKLAAQASTQAASSSSDAKPLSVAQPPSSPPKKAVPRRTNSRRRSSRKKAHEAKLPKPFLLPTLLLLSLTQPSLDTEASHNPSLPLIGSPASQQFAPSWTPSDAADLANNGKSELYLLSLPEQVKLPLAALPQEPASSPITANELINLARQGERLLLDPRGILSRQEREEIESRLRHLQHQAPYSVYVCIFDHEQEIGADLQAQSLLGFIGKPDEFKLMLQYRLGHPQPLSLGYGADLHIPHETMQLINESLQLSLMRNSGHAGAIFESLNILQNELEASSRHWNQRAELTRDAPPLIPVTWLDSKPVAAPEKPSLKQHLFSSASIPELWFLASLILTILLYLTGRKLRRRSACLIDTEIDYRLSSPVGASTCRQVHYLEGKILAKSSSHVMGPHRE